MMRAFAWKPRWATIRLVNSCERSTFDISSAPPVSEPSPLCPGVPSWAAPELKVAAYDEEPAFSSPLGLAKVARAMRPMASDAPLLNEPMSVPSAERVNDCRVPASRPSWPVTVTVLRPENPVVFDRSMEIPSTVTGPPLVYAPLVKTSDVAVPGPVTVPSGAVVVAVVSQPAAVRANDTVSFDAVPLASYTV